MECGLVCPQAERVGSEHLIVSYRSEEITFLSVALRYTVQVFAI